VTAPYEIAIILILLVVLLRIISNMVVRKNDYAESYTYMFVLIFCTCIQLDHIAGKIFHVPFSFEVSYKLLLSFFRMI